MQLRRLRGAGQPFGSTGTCGLRATERMAGVKVFGWRPGCAPRHATRRERADSPAPRRASISCGSLCKYLFGRLLALNSRPSLLLALGGLLVPRTSQVFPYLGPRCHLPRDDAAVHLTTAHPLPVVRLASASRTVRHRSTAAPPVDVLAPSRASRRRRTKLDGCGQELRKRLTRVNW